MMLVKGPILPGVPASANTGIYPREFWLELAEGAFKALYKDYVELDKPLNDCGYFVRVGRTQYGYYVREGKTSPMLLWQARNDYDLFMNTDFALWYYGQGWSRDSWWIPR